jgi:RNA polymerase sigma factor (sigma-70 family)
MAKEFYLTLRVQNNLLREQRCAQGLSAPQAAKAAGVTYTMYHRYESLKVSPLTCRGEWKSSALRIASYFQVLPETLWPAAILAVEMPIVHREMSQGEIYTLLERHTPWQETSPEQCAIEHEEMALIVQAVEQLSPKHREVMVRRFGLYGNEMQSLEEVGIALGKNRERIRQMQARAIRLVQVHVRKVCGTKRFM